MTVTQRPEPSPAGTGEPVRGSLAGSITLHDFLQSPGTLTLDDRRLIVEQALVLLEQNYVHLPLKVAMHAVNPVQRLRLMAIRLERQTPQSLDEETQFHAELSEIFHSLRDLHTNYLLPAPFAGKVAYLPFMVEEYFADDDTRHYVVSHVAQGFTRPGFGHGAELTHWNGIPIHRAVELNAARFAGSNAAARHARGVESLTIRPLVIHLPPDEEWVKVSYQGTDGAEHELRQDWLVVANLPPFSGDADAVSTTAASLGIDLDSHAAGRAKTMLFAPGVLQAIQEPAAAAAAAAAAGDLPTGMPGVFRARSVPTASGIFGHLRIFTFSVQDPDAFVEEFVRLVELLPQNGLILDVRDNGGGHIHASEFTLQTLTPRPITPEPVQFITMPLTLRICRKHADNPTGQIDLGPWLESLDQAREIGAAYSGAVPITPTAGANAIGQRYHGPVVLITNARCYSATDIFAAGFADHGIGPVLGVDENTGAGGANVWTHGLLKALLEVQPADPQSPYRALPMGANLRVSIRRTLRVGENAGVPVEDLGVRPDVRHAMTRRDVLEGNTDLLDRAGQLLAAMPVRALGVTASLDAGALHVDLQTSNIDLAVLHLDGVPRTSLDVSTGAGSVALDVRTALLLRVDGFSGGTLVASRTLALGAQAAPQPPVSAPGLAAGPTGTTLLYVHGAGNKPRAADLKLNWDRNLFGRDLGTQSVMAHYADLLHARPGSILEDACSLAEAVAGVAADGGLDDAGPDDAGDLLDGLTPQGQRLALSLSMSIAARSVPAVTQQDALLGLLPFPWLRQRLLRRLVRRLIPDADAYFFTDRREPIRQRLRQSIRSIDGPLVVVSHSLGTVLSYEVLSEPEFAGRDVRLLITMGCPLGYTEIQDVARKPLRVPAPVRQWTNVADPLDVIALDTGLANDFSGRGRLLDVRVNNPSPNNHAACGYLSTTAVRSAVTAAVTAAGT